MAKKLYVLLASLTVALAGVAYHPKPASAQPPCISSCTSCETQGGDSYCLTVACGGCHICHISTGLCGS